ncbi:DDE-type integrase/transposase/recombinase, partial [Paraburkholderia sp. BR14320]|uniref:DDE-type integrase/transposase/recombinase n=1 Tax=unclassified Paraburkholderia TaxID=2615204 RepID=UPI0034CF66C3
GNTVDFLLRAPRDKAAARAYFEKAIDQNGEPGTVTIDRSGSNLAALQAIKRRTRPMPRFKNFHCARILLGDIEVMHMIVKGQLNDGGVGQTPAQQFYPLAG